MCLPVEYFIGLLSLIQGLQFLDAQNTDLHNDPCIAKILSCDWYRQPFSLYRDKDIGMFTKTDDLNKACKEQDAFLRCIVRAENFCEKTNFPVVAKEMIKSRRFPAEICRPASPWQQLYLKEASCLNAYSRKAFAYCIDKIIGIGNLNPDDAFERGCKYRRAIIDCSAAALQAKCGYYAGNLLKKNFKFHSLSDYKCPEFKSEDIEYHSSSTLVYGIPEATNFLDSEDFGDEATEGDDANTNFEGPKQDYIESTISSDDLISKKVFTIFGFNQLADEPMMAVDYLSKSLESDVESQETTTEPNKLEFPPLPKCHYIHQNRTTFALYEDFQMGHMKYMGCGEADFFWIILSPLRSKYCAITDLKSEYSEVMFQCTIRIDAPCSLQLDEEDRSKKAEVFHRRYIATVFTPPNKQRSEDMAIMNVHYLKLYPSPLIHVPEEKVNLWTAHTKVNKANMVSVGRKGSFEIENDHSDAFYQHGNGSGQKFDNDTINTPNYLDEDEFVEEYEDWDYYPLEEKDIYFSDLRTNNIIYIEDEKGDLISLHDPRSPIYLKSIYQPNFLFRPRTGLMAVSTDSQNFDEMGTNLKKLIKRSGFKERVSEFENEAHLSKVKLNHQEHCFEEAPCSPNSEFISESGIKSGMYILSQNIKTFDPLDENKLFQQIPSSTKLNEAIDLKPFFNFGDVYVVTPSAKIEIQESTESSQIEKRYGDEFSADNLGYSLKGDEFATQFQELAQMGSL